MRVLTQGEIEHAIMDISDRLEAETARFADLCDEEAEAENAYKATLLRALMQSVHDRGDNGKPLTVKAREDQAALAAEPEAQAYRLAAAKLRASREALSTMRSRLDALRTLSANVRNQS